MLRTNVHNDFPKKARELEDLLDSYRQHIPEEKTIGWINLGQ